MTLAQANKTKVRKLGNTVLVEGTPDISNKTECFSYKGKWANVYLKEC